MSRRRLSLLWVVFGLLVVFPGVGALMAQERSGTSSKGGSSIEVALEREAAGDFGGAAELLAEILREEPSSIQALLAYERILRVQRDLEPLLGAIDRLLEVEPGSSLGHQLRVRTLAELDRESEIEAALVEWVRAMPRLETPYREAAQVWQGRGQYRRALRVLEDGRSRLGRKSALALELGEVALELGDLERAVREWGTAIGEDGRGYTLVRRRLAAHPDGGARVVPGLIEVLTTGKPSPARRRVAVELAIGSGQGGVAEEIARSVVRDLPASERLTFLVEVARRADGAHLPGLAYWSYNSLLAERLEEPLAVHGRLGELALELGDTAAAREHLRVLEEAHAPGSDERRQAVAVQIELSAQRRDGRPAAAALHEFRQEFPDAPETDRLAATIADRLLGAGERGEALGVLAGVSGPRTGMVKGRLALLDGDPTAARSAFLLAAPQLEGAEATEAIALIRLLRRLSPEGGKLLAEFLGAAESDSLDEGVGRILSHGSSLDQREYAVLLDYVAKVADRSRLAAEGERVRRLIVTELAGTPESAAALLALGRARALDRDGIDEARSFLERLLLEHPRSALVPQAVRELERLERRVGRGES